MHSDVLFTVRHLISKVRGRFQTIEGEIHAAENPLDSSVTITIDSRSVDTNNTQWDDHLRSSDFLEVGPRRQTPGRLHREVRDRPQ